MKMDLRLKLTQEGDEGGIFADAETARLVQSAKDEEKDEVLGRLVSVALHRFYGELGVMKILAHAVGWTGEEFAESDEHPRRQAALALSDAAVKFLEVWEK